MKNKKTIIVLSILTIIFTIIGGSLAYYNWQTSESQKTNIVFTVEGNFSCSADGGGDITSSDVMLAPASCTNSKYAIKREVTVTPKILGNGLNIDMDLWLDIDDLGEGLSKSKNFKYALTTEENSCTEGVIAEGTFEGKTKEDKIDLLTGKKYNQTTSDKYYLYIWLDAVETSRDTMDQTFNFSLNGICTEGDSFDDPTPMITSYSCANETVGNTPYFTYTGDCATEDDGDGNWRIKFLTDGTFTSNLNIAIDAFLVGGGGGGATGSAYLGGGGGGGGGYTIMGSTNLKTGENYNIIIGAGGGPGSNGLATTAFSIIALGGGGGIGNDGGSGGSGGGGGGYKSGSTGASAGAGGSDGSTGAVGNFSGGAGQELSTYEFGDSSLTLYSGGGGGAGANGSNSGSGGSGGGGDGGNSSNGETALPNTGGGGGGGSDGSKIGGSGGSGIVVIRNSKVTIDYEIDYTGEYAYIADEDNNWRIKFLTSGTLTPKEDIVVDAFLVGGGGGGGNGADYHSAGGGGGGGYTVVGAVKLKSGNQYEITIGEGGTAGQKGLSTKAFSMIAIGGNPGAGASRIGGGGGSGGSGGGGAGYVYKTSANAGAGGSNGSVGVHGNYGGGSGQATSTYEFGDSSLTLYAGGGGGGAGGTTNGAGGSGGGAHGGYNGIGGTAAPNTGGGGGGGGFFDGSVKGGGSGGSGVVVIRESKVTVDYEIDYTGEYAYISDEDNNWRIKFLTSGILTPKEDIVIDAFLVGGGGGGGNGANYYSGGGGGGGGYTVSGTVKLKSGNQYEITIGEGGTAGQKGLSTKAFSMIAIGGDGGVGSSITSGGGGSGGSGGGGGAYTYTTTTIAGAGGSNGSIGVHGKYGGGSGQETSTYEFGDSSLTLYAGGGGGGAGGTTTGAGGSGGGAQGGYNDIGGTAAPNTGGGGGGGAFYDGGAKVGGSGGSGVVVIRESKVTVDYEIDYTGEYAYISDEDNNWRIKFLTSGTLTPKEDIVIDAFLVGGGGGGGNGANYFYGGGGGGSGYTTTGSVELKGGTKYEIIIGQGGTAGQNGTVTTAFDLSANGGTAGNCGCNTSTTGTGGSGGSGGGGGGYKDSASGNKSGDGGTDGSDGKSGKVAGGTGQNTSTYEFGDSSLTLYAGGGGGGGPAIQNGSGGTGGGALGGYNGIGGTAAPNTGGGGGGGANFDGTAKVGGSGGSGVVVIRNKR